MVFHLRPRPGPDVAQSRAHSLPAACPLSCRSCDLPRSSLPSPAAALGIAHRAGLGEARSRGQPGFQLPREESVALIAASTAHPGSTWCCAAPPAAFPSGERSATPPGVSMPRTPARCLHDQRPPEGESADGIGCRLAPRCRGSWTVSPSKRSPADLFAPDCSSSTAVPVQALASHLPVAWS